jgi:hypothetical protein
MKVNHNVKPATRRYRVNSIPELELINLELELKFGKKKLNPQVNLPFNFLIQKYFFHGNPTWKINYSE